MCLAKSIEEIYAYLPKQSMPRQGTEIRKQFISFCNVLETINAPSGDGNPQPASGFSLGFLETINAPSGDGNTV